MALCSSSILCPWNSNLYRNLDHGRFWSSCDHSSSFSDRVVKFGGHYTDLIDLAARSAPPSARPSDAWPGAQVQYCVPGTPKHLTIYRAWSFKMRSSGDTILISSICTVEVPGSSGLEVPGTLYFPEFRRHYTDLIDLAARSAPPSARPSDAWPCAQVQYCVPGTPHFSSPFFPPFLLHVSLVVSFDPPRLERFARDLSAMNRAMPVAHILPLSDVALAHRLMEQGGVGGKIVLTP